MNFVDRTSLGEKLAQMLQDYYGKDAVIVCLQESSLLTSLTIASHIRAWVYPLIYEPVYTADHSHRLLGAYNQDEEFCALPDDPAETVDKTTKAYKDTQKVIKKQRPAAMKSIESQISSYAINIDKTRLDGRPVILVGDVVTSILPIVVAQELLADVTPKSVTAALGNVTPEVAQLVRINAHEAVILDILSGVYYDEHRYFEHADTYTAEQKHTLTQHIAAYWL